MKYNPNKDRNLPEQLAQIEQLEKQIQELESQPEPEEEEPVPEVPYQKNQQMNSTGIRSCT